VEDICGYFADGLAESVEENVLSKQGIATALSCSKEKPLDIRSIQGAVSVPADFGRVEDIVFGDDEIELRTVEDQSVIVPVNYEFVLGEKLSP
jgi:hypothetical protein